LAGGAANAAREGQMRGVRLEEGIQGRRVVSGHGTFRENRGLNETTGDDYADGKCGLCSLRQEGSPRPLQLVYRSLILRPQTRSQAGTRGFAFAPLASCSARDAGSLACSRSYSPPPG